MGPVAAEVERVVLVEFRGAEILHGGRIREEQIDGGPGGRFPHLGEKRCVAFVLVSVEELPQNGVMGAVELCGGTMRGEVDDTRTVRRLRMLYVIDQFEKGRPALLGPSAAIGPRVVLQSHDVVFPQRENVRRAVIQQIRIELRPVVLARLVDVAGAFRVPEVVPVVQERPSSVIDYVDIDIADSHVFQDSRKMFHGVGREAVADTENIERPALFHPAQGRIVGHRDVAAENRVGFTPPRLGK